MVAAVAHGGGTPAALSAGSGKRRALLVGGEGDGPSRASLARAAQTVTLRTPGRAESLNVVVATGILLDRMTSAEAR